MKQQKEQVKKKKTKPPHTKTIKEKLRKAAPPRDTRTNTKAQILYWTRYVLRYVPRLDPPRSYAYLA